MDDAFAAAIASSFGSDLGVCDGARGLAAR